MPFYPAIEKVAHTEEQKGMENRYHQCHNLDGAFNIKSLGAEFNGAVLLVDDITDSGWTLALAGALLRQSGSGPVYPFTLAATSAK